MKVSKFDRLRWRAIGLYYLVRWHLTHGMVERAERRAEVRREENGRLCALVLGGVL